MEPSPRLCYPILGRAVAVTHDVSRKEPTNQGHSNNTVDPWVDLTAEHEQAIAQGPK